MMMETVTLTGIGPSWPDSVYKEDALRKGLWGNRCGEPPVVAEADLRGERPVPEEEAGTPARRLLAVPA